MNLILASNSPRRRELMELLDIPFSVMASGAQEIVTGSDPAGVTEELSCQKARWVSERVKEGLIVGADTVVAVQGRILGKPRDREEAREMINSLQGREHMVYTGVTLLRKRGDETEIDTFSQGTRVRVMSMTGEEIEEYIATDEPYDKAGGYGIQGKFGKYIEGIRGDYYNVVGLPVNRLYRALKKMCGKENRMEEKREC